VGDSALGLILKGRGGCLRSLLSLPVIAASC
jgi:hypothetical protein